MAAIATLELTTWLQAFIGRHGGTAGTVHLLDGDVLVLAAAVNIPETVQQLTATIPRGKGMAGLAWERDRPVSSCNIKEDRSGDVRPGARAVDAQAAVALPLHRANGSFRGVVGIAFAEQRDLTEAELADLDKTASEVPSACPGPLASYLSLRPGSRRQGAHGHGRNVHPSDVACSQGPRRRRLLNTTSADVRSRSLRSAYDRGSEWLVSRQHSSGMWAMPLFTGEAIPSASLTAIAVEPLCDGPARDAYGDVIEKGVSWLVAHQNEDGSFGDGVGNVFYCAYASALVLVLLATHDVDRHAEPIRRTIEYLRNNQRKAGIYRGGVGYGMKEPFPDPRDPDSAEVRTYAALSPTSVAALGMRKAGVPLDDPFWGLLIDFCHSLHNSRAINRRGEITRFLHAAGYCLRDDGGLLNSLEVFETAPRRPPGTETPEPEPILSGGGVTYMAIRTYLCAGVPRDSPEVTSAVDWVRHHYALSEHAGMAEIMAAGQKPLATSEPARSVENPSSIGLYAYYKAMTGAFDELDLHPFVTADGVAHDWAAEIAEELLARQNEDGSWVNDRNPRFQEFDAVMSTALALSTAGVILKYVDS